MRSLLMVTVLALGAMGPIASAAPYVPASDSEILVRLHGSADPDVRDLKVARRELSAAPDNLQLAAAFADRAIALGRRFGDPRYIGYAKAALSPWWDQTTPPVPVLIRRAAIRQNQHQFDAALDDLARALALDPRQPGAWLMAATIHQARGDYEKSRAACQNLIRLNNFVIARACAANISGLTGDGQMAYDALLASDAQAGGSDETVRRWIRASLADVAARLDHPAVAEAHYRAALAIGTPDAHLRASYADFLLGRGRAMDVWRQNDDVNALTLYRAIAAKQLGLREFPDLTARLRAEFDQRARRGGPTDLRDYARFLLDVEDRPDAALAAALDNWHVQREPADTLLVLRAAHAAGRHRAATPVAAWVRAIGLEDIRIARVFAQPTGDAS